MLFQNYINQALNDCLNLFCVMYFDDILIFNKTQIKYVQHVKTVLQRLKKYKMYIKLSKYQFYVMKIEFLKFRIFTQNISIKSNHVKIIIK